MEYGARKFSKESYNNNDNFAKELFIKFIIQKGHTIINSEENYEHDIITEKDGKTYYFEVEVKHNYPFTDKKSFKFSTVSFLGRKLRLHKIQPFKYVIICAETLYAVACESKLIYKDDYIEELDINKYERKGKDAFYRVPKDDCVFFNIK